jgi:DNA modification methylase
MKDCRRGPLWAETLRICLKNQISLEIGLTNKFNCPLCNRTFKHLGEHIKEEHGEDSLKKLILESKEADMSDAEIGSRYGVSFRQLEKIITEAYGANISVLVKRKKIQNWSPKNFTEESGTIWSFKQRGNWATHDGRYRGNWSPYIPRNVILKYSRPGDLILDYFVGGGTTAIEAKLLGRRCIARDINPWAPADWTSFCTAWGGSIAKTCWGSMFAIMGIFFTISGAN